MVRSAKGQVNKGHAWLEGSKGGQKARGWLNGWCACVCEEGRRGSS